MKSLDLPEGYIQVNTSQTVRADDLEGDPRGFSGWRAPRKEIVGKPFCACWGVIIIRRPE